jgi:3-oxoadipate enol-lactonase
VRRWLVAGAAATAGAWAWTRWMDGRNSRITRPPVRDPDGRPYPVRRFQHSDGEEVEVHVVGRGPTVLLLPGADGIKETWRYQIPALASRYRVIAPDLRSSFPPGAGFERLAADALELLDAYGYGQAIVVGQSLGGAIAMRLAAGAPGSVAALVLANTLAHVGYEHVGLNRTLLVPVAVATTRYLPTGLSRAVARLWSRLDVWIYDSSPGGGRVVDYALRTGPRTVLPSVSGARVKLLKREDLRPELPAIEAPAIVVKGPRDRYTPPSWAREIAALIPGARYVELDGTGHCSHISMPGSFNRLVLEWLDAVAGPEQAIDASPGRGQAIDAGFPESAAPAGASEEGCA